MKNSSIKSFSPFTNFWTPMIGMQVYGGEDSRDYQRLREKMKVNSFKAVEDAINSLSVNEPSFGWKNSKESNSYYLSVDMPGIEASDLEIKATDKTVSIVAKTETRSYSYSTTLPENTNFESIQGSLKNGVLNLTIEGVVEVKPKEFTVTVK